MSYLKCRTCAKSLSREKMIDIFSDEHQSVLSQLKIITGIIYKRELNVSDFFCIDCQLRLEDAWDFRATCKRAQHELQQLAKATKSTKTQSNIMYNDSKNAFKIEVANKIKMSPVLEFEENYDDSIEMNEMDGKEVTYELVPHSTNEKYTIHKSQSDSEKPILFEVVIQPDITQNDSNPIELQENIDMEKTEIKIDFNENVDTDVDDEVIKNYDMDDGNISYLTDVGSFLDEQKSEFEDNCDTAVPMETNSPKKETKKYKKNKNRKGKGKKYGKKEQTFVCYLCGIPFDNLVNFDTHMSRHRSEKAYECKLCSKKFYTQNQLKSHVCTRTEDRTFRCQQCRKSFFTRNGLNNHMLVHSTEHNFQ